jgi:hypothetical protein
MVGGGKVYEIMEKKLLLRKLLEPGREEQLEIEKNPE